jgi:hypothetical protein
MNIITAAIITLAVSCTLLSVSHPAIAAGSSDQANETLNSLAGSAVPTTQLSTLRGGNFVVSSANVGIDTGNSANNSPTGSIADNQSIDNNTGITTIFQNTGNNALFQSSTTVNISVH